MLLILYSKVDNFITQNYDIMQNIIGLIYTATSKFIFILFICKMKMKTSESLLLLLPTKIH